MKWFVLIEFYKYIILKGLWRVVLEGRRPGRSEVG